MSERTLSDHGVAWRFRGFPIYAERESWDDDPPIIGYMDEPQWREADLTPEHWNELAEWFAQDQSDWAEAGREPPADAELVYLLLDRNGVEHEHIRGKPIYAHRPAYGYECAMCKAYLVVKDPGDFRFRGGPADGRWIVTDGSRTWRIPVPSRLSAVFDDPLPPAPTMDAATYTRWGQTYVTD